MSRRNAVPAMLLALALGASQGLSAAALKVTPPKLQVEKHRLANGLEVLLHQDRSVPVVDVQVWYHVGSKDERQGRSGFAHLFEHLMFKGTENLPGEEYSDYIASIGGRMNATTDFDRTLYFQTVPSNYLERILWMEADRMRALDLSEANFVAERDVVKEERRMRIENPPFGRLFEVVLDKSYTTHPYRILPIGSMADLNAATVEDVRDFHRTYYVPDNATLVLSGDFDAAQTMRWIETYFGSIPRGAKPIPRAIPAEPAQTAERTTVAYDANAPLPAVIFSYHIPEAGHADLYALEVAGNILSNGQSSRLYRKLVYEQQIALGASGQTVTLEDPGVFFFYAILQADRAIEDGVKALQTEVDRLRNEPVSREELEKAKNQLIASGVFERQTVQNKGNALGYAHVILGDVSLADRQLAEYQKVTAEDVQRVAKTYFRPENRTVVQMLPEALRPKEVKP